VIYPTLSDQVGGTGFAEDFEYGGQMAAMT